MNNARALERRVVGAASAQDVMKNTNNGINGAKNIIKVATLMFKLTIVINNTNCCQFRYVTPSVLFV